jgi:cytochrome c oxidase assembly protein subunit 15
MLETIHQRKNLFRISLSLLIYTLLVILWGAWVRISHSGNGCGDTWPLCQGVLIPESERPQTWIEFTHRLMSGAYGLVVIGLFLALRKHKNEKIRQAAKYTLIFMISEALLGAKLVLFGLVGNNDSAYRALVMALHLVNSFLLVAWNTKLLWESSTKSLPDLSQKNPISLKLLQISKNLFPACILIIAIFGAWASLSNTLFPSTDLLAGWKEDFAPDSHWILRLRFFHPLVASVLGPLCIVAAITIRTTATDHLVRLFTLRWLLALAFGLVFGYLTLFSLSPVWMKLTHLTIGYTLWIGSLLIRYRIQETSGDFNPRNIKDN